MRLQLGAPGDTLLDPTTNRNIIVVPCMIMIALYFSRSCRSATLSCPRRTAKELQLGGLSTRPALWPRGVVRLKRHDRLARR